MSDLEAQLRKMIRAIVKEEIRAVLDDAQREQYLSADEAAEIAGVSPSTIRSWVQQRRLSRHNAGRLLRVVRSELEALLRTPRAVANDTGNLTPEQLAERDFG